METKTQITVKNHIDAPILKTVAMMNLFGLRTTWACAGMHYDNPEVKKDHAQVFQIFFHADAKSFEKAVRLLDSEILTFAGNLVMFRIIKQFEQEPMLLLIGTQKNPADMWGHNDSPHHHEYTNMVIRVLNKRLLEFKDEFAEQATISDQNGYMKSVMPHWAYEPAADWTFTKEEILEMP